jgi:hypothetical protein
MKHITPLIALALTCFCSAPVTAKNSKNSLENVPACPPSLAEGACDEYVEGYLNGVADRGAGENNVFSNSANSDAYKLGYEKGWKGGHRWE